MKSCPLISKLTNNAYKWSHKRERKRSQLTNRQKGSLKSSKLANKTPAGFENRTKKCDLRFKFDEGRTIKHKSSMEWDFLSIKIGLLAANILEIKL